MDKETESVPDYKLDKICRICLQEKEKLIFLFSMDYPDICQKIQLCGNVNIMEDDGLPSNICDECFLSLSNSFNFRILCEESDRVLRQFLNRDKEIKTEDDEAPQPFHPIDIIIKEEPDTEDDEDTVSNDNYPEADVEVTEQPKRPIRKIKKHCPYCGGDVTGRDLTIHLKSCAVFGSSYETKERGSKKREAGGGKRSYIRRKPLRIHRCEPCNKVFASRKCWVRHNTIKHGIEAPPKPQPICKVCKANFKCWSELLDHERIMRHYGKEDCPYCDKSYSRSYISQHLREHTSEEPFLCNACGRVYTKQSSFFAHIKCCANVEKSLKCSRCDKKFHTRNRLSQHERMHSDEKPYVCETCGTGFRRRSNLRNHVMVHSDSRPYECQMCQKKFRNRTVLNEHMRVHTGDRPYVCDICDAAFTQNHCLKTHKMKHGDGKVHDDDDDDDND